MTKILNSKPFKNAPKYSTIFGYLVDERLAGREASINTILQDRYANNPNADHSTVSMAVADVRSRLDTYYRGEGAGDPWRIGIPVGKFVPRIETNVRPAPTAAATVEPPRVEEGPAPEPMPTAAVPPGMMPVAGSRADRWTRARKSAMAAALLAVVVVGVLVAQSLIAQPGSGIRITSPTEGATVGLHADVSGKGWQPKLNNYLVSAPEDQSGRKWIQFQIASPEWRDSANFGQPNTPNGMHFRVYVLSTPTVLPIGEITKEPASPQESPAVTVVLQK